MYSERTKAETPPTSLVIGPRLTNFFGRLCLFTVLISGSQCAQSWCPHWYVPLWCMACSVRTVRCVSCHRTCRHIRQRPQWDCADAFRQLTSIPPPIVILCCQRVRRKEISKDSISFGLFDSSSASLCEGGERLGY